MPLLRICSAIRTKNVPITREWDKMSGRWEWRRGDQYLTKNIFPEEKSREGSQCRAAVLKLRSLDPRGSASHSLRVREITGNELLKLYRIIKNCVSTHGNHCANKTKILIQLLLLRSNSHMIVSHKSDTHHFSQDALSVQLLLVIS